MATTDRTRLASERPNLLQKATFQIVGFTLLVIATLWLSFLAAGDSTLHIDVSITRFIQDRTSTVTKSVADFGNAFGAAKVCVPLGIAFALFLFWRGRPRGGTILLIATAMRVVNYGLKALFDSPRPTPDLVRVETNLNSNGFPSGHAQGATLLCGAALIAFWPLLRRVQRIAACVVACAIVLATCYARISVGAHWPTDVLGGVLWGAVLLVIAWFATSRKRSNSRASTCPE
jgi:membrane-associated phospholipid phosphatase